MFKIYTKSGDKGTTQLSSGERVSKDETQVEAIGTIDELNAHIGLLMTYIEEKTLLERLHDLQTVLFDIGGNKVIDHSLTTQLEKDMDAMTESLPPLRDFVYPGGCKAAAQSHVCRTVCTRDERNFVTFSKIRPIDARVLCFLKRLSDYFFILARKLKFIYNVAEKTW